MPVIGHTLMSSGGDGVIAGLGLLVSGSGFPLVASSLGSSGLIHADRRMMCHSAVDGACAFLPLPVGRYWNSMMFSEHSLVRLCLLNSRDF